MRDQGATRFCVRNIAFCNCSIKLTGVVVDDGTVCADRRNGVKRKADIVGLLLAQVLQLIRHIHLRQRLGELWGRDGLFQPAKVGAECNGVVDVAAAMKC